MEPDSLSYLTQIIKLQSHSAVSGLSAFCKIPWPNFNCGRRFCASGKKCKRNIQRYVEFKSLFFPYGWGVLVYFTALLNWTTPSTFTCSLLQKPKNCYQPRKLRQTECWKPGIFLRLHTVNSLSPCVHLAITDTPITRTAVKSQEKTNYRRLTEINSRYYGLSLMRTLTRGPYGVRYNSGNGMRKS